MCARAGTTPRNHGCATEWPKGGVMQPMNPLRNQRFWGATALAVAAIVGLVAAYLYVSPPNQRTVAFYTDDAASVHPGDTVRIAGIVGGAGTDRDMEPNQV